MTRVAGSRMVARARETAEPPGGIVLLEGVVGPGVGRLLAGCRWHARLLGPAPLVDALGVFVLLVLGHGCLFRCRIVHRGRLSRPKNRKYRKLFCAMLMPLFATALPADTINLFLWPCGWG